MLDADQHLGHRFFPRKSSRFNYFLDPPVMMSADDYDADVAERYGWINRALPAATLGEFVRSLAHRIASFPAAGRVTLKDRVNAISLAPADDFRRDSDLFLERARDPEMQRRTRLAMSRGFQTHEGELALATLVGSLVDG